MRFVLGLRCRECGTDYPQEALHVCEQCFGPLDRTIEAVAGSVATPFHIDVRLQDFDALYGQLTEASTARAVAGNRVA